MMPDPSLLEFDCFVVSRMRNLLQVGAVLMLLIAGCSGAPARVKPPKINPSSAAAQAMELYDTDHDGKLSQAEAAKCPGVLVAFDRYDANHDKFIDASEFEEHLQELLKHGTGGTALSCNIIYDGHPLADATVVLDPEPYLGTEIQSAEGVTASYGAARVGIAADRLPAELQRVKLVQYGTFKVRVTHPKIKIPAKYNTDTTLGYETIPGDPAASFTLTSK
jgi:hypothetical protein